MNNLEELAYIVWEKIRNAIPGFPPWEKLPRFYKEYLMIDIGMVLYQRSKFPCESSTTDKTH
jgi:GTP1/Obg family GTP-binding protein